MDWLWIIKQPWFDVSPNIVALAWYCLCAIIGARQLLRKGARYKRWPKLIAFTDGLFLIGIIVVIQDTGWLLFSTLKWYSLYSSQMSLTGYWIRYPQNLVGLCLLILLSYGLWKARLVSLTRHTVFWLFIIYMIMGINFILAPDPSWTDYTYAVRVHAPDWQILSGFLAYLLMKLLMTFSFMGLFRIDPLESSSGTEFQSPYKGCQLFLLITEEAETIGNAVKQWKKGARIPGFKPGRKFCNAKGTKNPGGTCPHKKIGRAPKGKRGIYYVFCMLKGECSCQSIYPKILRIPVMERLKPPMLKAVGRRR